MVVCLMIVLSVSAVSVNASVVVVLSLVLVSSELETCAAFLPPARNGRCFPEASAITRKGGVNLELGAAWKFGKGRLAF